MRLNSSFPGLAIGTAGTSCWVVEPIAGWIVGQYTMSCQVNQLLPHLQLLVQAAFLRQIADDTDMTGAEFLSKDQDFTFIGIDNLIDNPNQCGLAGSIGS